MSDPSVPPPTPQIPAWQRTSSQQPKDDGQAQERGATATGSGSGSGSASSSSSAVTSQQPSQSSSSPETEKSNGSENAGQGEEKAAGKPSTSDDSNGDDSKELKEMLFESAKKWLEDDSIKGTPTSDKISFLEEKGLGSEDVRALLGLVEKDKDVGANATSTTNAASLPAQTQTLSSMIPRQQPQQPASSSTAAPASSSSSSSSTTASPPPPPPIITYPEFLTTPNHQPPLLTLPALLGTVYGVTGLAASAWAASKYLLNPMINSLAEARLDFNDNAKRNVEELNRKLEDVVSEVPASAMPVKKITRPGSRSGTFDGKTAAGAGGEDDGEQEDEDPTELFHRDMGVQTDVALLEARAAAKEAADAKKNASPFRARSRSSARGSTSRASSAARPPPPLTASAAAAAAANASVADDKPFPQSAPDTATHNSTQLTNLLSSLREFAASEREHDESSQQAQRRVQDLQMYLDGMTYCVPSYLNQFGYAMDDGASGYGGKDDAISNFRKEIRSVKGTLLSAKNFPAARRR